MGLADEAAKHDTQPGRECGMARLIKTTDLTDDELNEAFDRGLTSASIQRALKARYPNAPGEQSVNRHRRGICSCVPR